MQAFTRRAVVWFFVFEAAGSVASSWGRGQAPAQALAPSDTARLIAFGTSLDPQVQMRESRALAESLAKPGAATWRAKGDQKRTYRFPGTTADVPFRVCVPASWNGQSALPLVLFLHGAGNTESSYLDQNNKQMVKLADQHGYVLVSPLGYQGAYGTFLKLPAVFGQQAEADKLLAQKTAESERTNELSEKDVIHVLEQVLREYPIDTNCIFLTGHSMGSGGTWYLGAKYAKYWRALAPMSGPFVLEQGYPWAAVKTKPVFVTEGTAAATLASSRVLYDWMMQQKQPVKYKEVNADHPGMVPLVLPDVFAFFDSVRTAPVSLGQGLREGRRAPKFQGGWTARGDVLGRRLEGRSRKPLKAR